MMNIAEIISKVGRHETYSNTFLYWVIVKINYVCEKEDSYDSYRKFFESFPGLNFTNEVYKNLKTTPVRFKTNDSKLSVKIDDDFIQLRIRGDVYTNFESSVMPLLQQIDSLLIDIKTNVSKMELRKINLWGFTPQKRDSGNEMLRLVLSKVLMANWKPFSQEDNGEEIMLTRLTGCENIADRECSLGVAYGYMQPMDPNAGLGRVILDTRCEIEERVEAKDMPELFNEMNSRMYDMYHWAVSEKTIELMKK